MYELKRVSPKDALLAGIILCSASKQKLTEIMLEAQFEESHKEINLAVETFGNPPPNYFCLHNTKNTFYLCDVPKESLPQNSLFYCIDEGCVAMNLEKINIFVSEVKVPVLFRPPDGTFRNICKVVVAKPSNGCFVINLEDNGLYRFSAIRVLKPITIEVNGDHSVLSDGQEVFLKAHLSNSDTLLNVTDTVECSKYTTKVREFTDIKYKHLLTAMPKEVRRAYKDNPELVRQQLHEAMDLWMLQQDELNQITKEV